MLFDDTYRTLHQSAEALFTDRGSKFIGLAFPIKNEQQFKFFLDDVKQKHPKAAHHCWALRFSPDRSVFKLNDDGEPSGTAGRPILNMLLSKDITNVGLIVVRYFGGTLLGVPGLINAYKTTAENTINAASIVSQTLNDIYTITFDYLQTNNVMRLIKDEKLQVLNQAFDNQSTIQIAIRKTQVNLVLSKLNTLDSVVTKYNYTS